MNQTDRRSTLLKDRHGRACLSTKSLHPWRLRCLGAITFGVSACASIGGSDTASLPNDSPAPEEPSDAGVDATTDGGRPCVDCEYFPDVCSPETLCPNDPFGSNTRGEGLDPLATINVIRGRSVDDVWAAGTLGALGHFSGAAWTRSDLGSGETLHALWFDDSGEVAVSSFVHAYIRGFDLADAGVSPSSDGWILRTPSFPIVSDRTLVQNRQISLVSAWGPIGGNWLWYATVTNRKAVSTRDANGLWRMRRSAANELELRSVTSASMCTRERCSMVNNIHGASANELWAVGELGSATLVSNADGDTPSVVGFDTQTRNSLNGVWVTSTSDAWAVGANGTIRHYSGDAMQWQSVSDVPTAEDLQAVWGSSSSDVWAVGDAGVVVHYDGQSWSRVKIAGLGERRPDLKTVWVPEKGHVWVGGQGVVLSLGGKP